MNEHFHTVSAIRRFWELPFSLASFRPRQRGAATIHHFDSAASSGSEGASAFTNASAAGSALQGTVASSPDTSFSIPFGVLGEYNFGSQFGIGRRRNFVDGIMA